MRIAKSANHPHPAIRFPRRVPRSAREQPAVVPKLAAIVHQLYAELSNVVHPKAYNFSTAGPRAFEFRANDLATTLSYATKVSSGLSIILAARFAELGEIVMSARK